MKVLMSVALAIVVIGATGLRADETNQVIEVQIAKRKIVEPDGGNIRIYEDDTVELRWSGDEKAELHIHGYDVLIHITPGEATSTVITGHATGRFPITSHHWGDGSHGHDALAYLEVYPK